MRKIAPASSTAIILESYSANPKLPAKRLRLLPESVHTGANPLSILNWQPRRADAALHGASGRRFVSISTMTTARQIS